MKKFVFLFGLLITTVFLSACGSKDFKMSFEEALEIANHSELQTILADCEKLPPLIILNEQKMVQKKID